MTAQELATLLNGSDFAAERLINARERADKEATDRGDR
jgi:hypothetical protein